MAGHLTGLAWAGSNNTNIADDFYDVAQERNRREQILKRIRQEERREGIFHPESQEDKYDRWVESGTLSSAPSPD